MNGNDKVVKSRKRKSPIHNSKRAKWALDDSSDEENACSSFFSLAASKQPFTFSGCTVELPSSDDSDDDDDGDGNDLQRVGNGDANNWKRNVVDLDNESDDENDESYLVESDDEKPVKMQKQQGNAVNRSPSPLPTTKISSTCLARVRKELGGAQSTSDLDRALSDLRKVARGDVISPSPATPRNSSICIDLDDSLTYASPSERDIVVKVRTRHGIKRFPTKAADQFQQIIKQLADMEGVNEDNILLSLRDENIVPFDTPLAVRLTVADIIECVVMESNAANNSFENEENFIEIKVQGSDNASKKTFKVAKDAPLSTLMKEYSKFRNLPRSKITYVFDGDVIVGNETPADLDMENEDMIDVRTKQ